MRPDIRGLREFYGTRLGKYVRARIAHMAIERWPDTKGDTMLGLGYATPVIRFFLRRSGPEGAVIAAMPRGQGALYWPARADNRTAIVHKHELPFAPNAIHRAVLMHALEFAVDPEAVVKELWRVLTPGGRALICVPHRRSIWSGASATPFGYGTPYNVAQLRHLLERAGFTFMQADMLLHMPPVQARLLHRLRWLFEGLGTLLPGTGGLLVMEVEKQIYAGIAEKASNKATKVVWVPAAG